MSNRLIVRSPLIFAIFLCLAENANAQIRGTLVVTNKGDNTASIIDLASARIVATIPTGNGPHEVAMSSDGRIAVATDYGAQTPGNSLTVIDVENASLIKRIDLGVYSRPHGASFLPGDSLLAVTSESTRNVIIVRIPEGDVVRTISTDQDGSHMVTSITSAGLAYTSNIRSGTISELNIDEGNLNRIIEVAPRVEAIQVTPDGREVWVGSNERGTVSIIETENGGIAHRLTGFSWAYRVAFTPDSRLALVPDLRNNHLRIFLVETREELQKVDLPGTGPEGITTTPDGKIAFLSLSQQDRIAVIDLVTMQVSGNLRTGSRPDGVGYSTVETLQ